MRRFLLAAALLSLPQIVWAQSRGGYSDPNNAAFQGVVPITPGTPVNVGRSIGFVITTGGNVTLTLADGSTITLTLTANTALQTLPFAVTNVSLGTGTAGTFWNLQ
jgi:hypothetical protein